MKSKSTPVMAILAGLFAFMFVSGTISVLAQEGSELRVGMTTLSSIDPALGSNDPEILFNRSMYDYLVDIAPDSTLVPNLATDWSISDDNLTYTFNLLEGVTFHDGSAMTSADVVHTFERLQAVESPAVNLMGEFTVAADGDNAVVFTLAAPNADFLFGVASRFAFILDDAIAEPNVLVDGDDPFVNFNGTGPFILTAYDGGSQGTTATLTANENYWMDGQPGVDTLTFVFYADGEPTPQINDISAGNLDFVFKMPFDRLADMEAAEGVMPIVKATNQHPVIRLRSDEGHLGEDVRIRQAFKYATDREILNLDLFNGEATIGNNDPIGPLYGMFYDDSIENLEADPEMACQLLAEAGYPDGLGADEPLDFYVDNSFNYVTMAEFLQQQWAEGCININILPRDAGQYYSDGEWMEVDLAVTAWGSRPIPQPYLVQAYRSDGVYNESHWANETLDALIDSAGVTADLDERAAIYSEIAQLFAEEGPIIVPFFAPIVGASSERITGLDMHPFPGRTDLRTVTVAE